MASSLTVQSITRAHLGSVTDTSSRNVRSGWSPAASTCTPACNAVDPRIQAEILVHSCYITQHLMDCL